MLGSRSISSCSRSRIEKTYQAVFELDVKKVYFDSIKAKTKTVEGRICRPKYQRMEPGDMIKFNSAGGESIFCKINKVERFIGFKEMVEAKGHEKCIPGSSSVQAAVDVYHRFPGYRVDEKKFGVLGIEIKYLPNHKV